MKKIKIEVQNIRCEGCAQKILAGLLLLGIEHKAIVQVPQHTVLIETDDSQSALPFKKKLEELDDHVGKLEVFTE